MCAEIVLMTHGLVVICFQLSLKSNRHPLTGVCMSALVTSSRSVMLRFGSRLGGKDLNNSKTSSVGLLAGLCLAFDRLGSSSPGIGIGFGFCRELPGKMPLHSWDYFPPMTVRR